MTQVASPGRPSLREIGNEAVWSLSTAKPGNGVEQIRDDNIDTYWQSDGGQPHLINVQFHKKMSIVEIAFYLDYNLDESYTPKKLSVRAGTTFHDLVEVQTVELNEPMGWVAVPLAAPPDPDGSGAVPGALDEKGEPLPADPPALLRAHFLQICVVSMHQNGRDTHIRQIKIYSPRRHLGQNIGCQHEFSSVAFQQYATIR